MALACLSVLLPSLSALQLTSSAAPPLHTLAYSVSFCVIIACAVLFPIQNLAAAAAAQRLSMQVHGRAGGARTV